MAFYRSPDHISQRIAKMVALLADGKDKAVTIRLKKGATPTDRFRINSRDMDSLDLEALKAATAVLDITADITLTSVGDGKSRNGNTFTLEVAAAADNPTDTILAEFTGTAGAIVLTITPNDGTNNGATPVDLTTAELVELINTGAVVGKTVTVTDASALRALQTAAGGDATALADAGEGDGVVGTFSGGEDQITFNYPDGDPGSEIFTINKDDIEIVNRLRTKKYLIDINAVTRTTIE